MNMMEKARRQVAELTQVAYEKAAQAGKLPAGQAISGQIEVPKDPKNGDWANSFALAAAKPLGMNPRQVAQTLVDELELEDSYFSKVDIAGPGFLNFTLGEHWFAEVLAEIEAQGADYGRSDEGRGKKIMVEFVSANPTGPMHMGNARGGVLGDTLSAILERLGYQVAREFYVNDAGNQIAKFAHSIEARYLQLIRGEDAVAFPEDGYQGEDIRELAAAYRAQFGDTLADAPEEERQEVLARFGLERNIPKMKEDLLKYGIQYDTWFLESTLHDSGAVEQAVGALTQKGYTYEKEGAIWLNTTKLLQEKFLREGKSPEQVEKLELKDDVLRRANGFYTYFAADIAYHQNKLLDRGFDTAINVWGADHHGHVARLQAALDALGLDGSNRLVIVLMQLVNLLQDGKPVRMSKRSGKAIALHDLLDEVSVDAARFFFNNSKPTSPVDFDLGLAVREDSENPVYYVQYAHARICTLIAKLAQEEGLNVPAANAVKLNALTSPEELTLLKSLARYPEEIRTAARNYDPSQINHYLVTLAGDFHRFYNANRIKGEAPDVAQARLKLADATRAVIANGLGLLGVTAPVKM